EVAEGLQHAHRHGIVHRDVKPPNIMVMPDRSVKIMDFGIALVTQSATRLTKSGMVPGTLKYMAPEQFKGSVTDALSDIFSYGVTFYEFVTGVHPFEAPTSPAVMFRIVGSEPDSLRAHMSDCPQLLEQVILRALSKDRAERYQTLEDLQLDLRPVLADLQKQQARGLVEEARRHADEGRQEDAQSMLRRILALDPMNADAMDLRRKLQSGIQTQNARARVEELLRTGRSRVEVGEYQQAMETLEDVLRLDGANTQAQQLLETARSGVRVAQHSRQLIREARQALNEGDVPRALEAAQRAAEADPASPEAFELTRTARSAMEEVWSAQREKAKAAMDDEPQLRDVPGAAVDVRRLTAHSDRAETAVEIGDRTPVVEAAPRSKRSPIWMALAALVLALGGGGYLLTRPKPAAIEPVASAPIAPKSEAAPAAPAPAETPDSVWPAEQPKTETVVVAQQERKPAGPAAGAAATSAPATVASTASASTRTAPATSAAPRSETVSATKTPPPAVEPRASEESLWAAVNKQDAPALREFAQKHASSRYARDAQRLAAELEAKAEAERQNRAQAEAALREAEKLRKLQADAAARAIEEAKKAEGLRGERNAIYAALARYASAFDQKDVAALQAAWPGIPTDSLDGLKRAFHDKNTRMTMSLQPLSDPEIHDSSATVAAQLSTITIQKGRPSNSPVRKVTIQLVKRNSLWTIQSIQN
ncbi:MAG: protein kinase, partial [Bryobacterales bacterium]|nr:protein kinase [Bryobacterales bacterium]